MDTGLRRCDGKLRHHRVFAMPAASGVVMSLSPEQVKSVAKLARLSLREEELPRYAQNLSDILAMIEQLNAVDTQRIEPMAHSQDMSQRLRPDAVTETDQCEDFQAIAPQTQDGLYLVPKVIE
ncbi:MAG: Asp-tRNA(Asn)/Glu-tRNA(Gln) amidotransferase subunit GatC [Burkholderiales bacterium]